MSVAVNIPDELYKEVLEIAEQAKVSVDQVLASALASQIRHTQRLNERAGRAERERYLAVVDRVPDVEPDPGDHLP